MTVSSRKFNLGGAGMRGVIGPGLTPAAAADFAAAYATLNPEGPILVGVDPRGSSEMLKCAVISALTGCGCSCVDGGVLTAGMMHFLIPHRQFAGGMLITGGHQAAGWNAVIPLAADGSYFDAVRQRELFDLYHAKSFSYVEVSGVKKVQRLETDALEAYWRFLRETLDVEAIRAAGFTVVADFCNGSGAAHAARFSRELGVKLIGINDSVSPVIPRDPEPRPRSESPLRSIIAPLGASMGLVFNRDASRLGVVSDGGEPFSEELTFPLAADYLLERLPAGSRVVTNVCTSRVLDDVVRKRHGILDKCRVGQANVVDLMRLSGAVLGGEGSGSFACGGLRGFDGLLMAGVLLEAVAVRRASIGEQRDRLPRYHMVKQTISSDSPHAYAQLRRFRREFGENSEVSDLDGLRFDWEDGFLSLRLATTQPMLRMISESNSPDLAEERAWRARMLWEHPRD